MGRRSSGSPQLLGREGLRCQPGGRGLSRARPVVVIALTTDECPSLVLRTRMPVQPLVEGAEAEAASLRPGRRVALPRLRPTMSARQAPGEDTPALIDAAADIPADPQALLDPAAPRPSGSHRTAPWRAPNRSQSQAPQRPDLPPDRCSVGLIREDRPSAPQRSLGDADGEAEREFSRAGGVIIVGPSGYRVQHARLPGFHRRSRFFHAAFGAISTLYM